MTDQNNHKNHKKNKSEDLPSEPSSKAGPIPQASGDLTQSIGKTPLLLLRSLQKETGCEIYGKAEFLNPGGSLKDRTAWGIIRDAQASGALRDGMTIYEGTAGNTGIGIAMLAAHFGYRAVIVMPDNQANEKYLTLEAYGAKVIKVPPCPFSNPNHFYHQARSLSQDDPLGFWADQFENTSNFKIHFETTGPEIWAQTNHKMDLFVCASGTGGTISGVSRFLKMQNPQIKVFLADPKGSGLYSFIEKGELIAEGSSITEGIGIMRLTANFKKSLALDSQSSASVPAPASASAPASPFISTSTIDGALQIQDQDMLNMLYKMAQQEGLLIGTSSALNLCAAVQLAKQFPKSRIVTILADSALRYQSKVFNRDWLTSKGLNIPSGGSPP